MFRTNAVLFLADMGLNALPLAKMDQDALVAAASMLRRATPDTEPSEQDLLREANLTLPSLSDQAGILRIFWASKRELEDGPVNALTDLANFISDRAAILESDSHRMLKTSQDPQEWIGSLSRLSEAYSYVVEAAASLQDIGLVAMRRNEDLVALTTIPDATEDFAGHQLFTKAMAIYNERVDGEKQVLKEQYR